MATAGGKPPSLDDDVDMADLASLNAPPSSSAAGAGASRFVPRAKGKLKPKSKPKAEPEPLAEPKPEREVEMEAEVPAPPEVVAMEADRVGDAAGLGDGDAAGLGEGEEDFVVREIDVYFTPKPFDDDTKLYVMQYPLRPCWRPYELNEICEEVRVKPLSSEVEVDLNVDMQSENYNQEVSTPLRLTKQTLSSSKAADVADYAVGVLKGNLVNLNHIDAVLQLRPSLSHLHSSRSHARQALLPRETNGGTSGSKTPSRKGNEHPEDSKDCTEDFETSLPLFQPWISLGYQPAGSNIATKYLDKVISNEGGPIDFTMSKLDYVKSLCPGASSGSKHINKCQAIREMLFLPLEDRLKKWFTEVSEVSQFDALKHLAPTYSEEEILKVLPEYAYLVNGLWVCKSSLLFDDGYALKRDRILLEFTKRESIPSSIVENNWSIRPQQDPKWRRILFPLCKKRGSLNDYKFISADLSFLKCYPHIVNEQKFIWSAREMTIHESLEMCDAVARKTNSSTRPNVPSKRPQPSTSKGTQGSEDLARSVLGTVFTANKVRSMQAVIRDLRQLATKYASNRKDGQKLQALANAATSCASLPHNELRNAIGLVAVPVHDIYIAKHEKMRCLRNVLIKLFRDKEPNATLTRQEILKAAVETLRREVTENEYHQAVTEICNSAEDGNYYLLKNGDEP